MSHEGRDQPIRALCSFFPLKSPDCHCALPAPPGRPGRRRGRAWNRQRGGAPVLNTRLSGPKPQARVTVPPQKASSCAREAPPQPVSARSRRTAGRTHGRTLIPCTPPPSPNVHRGSPFTLSPNASFSLFPARGHTCREQRGGEKRGRGRSVNVSAEGERRVVFSGTAIISTQARARGFRMQFYF